MCAFQNRSDTRAFEIAIANSHCNEPLCMPEYCRRAPIHLVRRKSAAYEDTKTAGFSWEQESTCFGDKPFGPEPVQNCRCGAVGDQPRPFPQQFGHLFRALQVCEERTYRHIAKEDQWFLQSWMGQPSRQADKIALQARQVRDLCRWIKAELSVERQGAGDSLHWSDHTRLRA